MTNAETQIESFFAKYEPPIAKLGKALRAKLRARLPGLLEIVYVYERQESLVISYTPTEHGRDGVCTLALYPREVKLFFAHGPELSKSDPRKLLQGSSKTVRYVALGSAADFDRPEVEALIAAVLKLSKVSLVANAKTSTVIKADEQKQRARQAAARAKTPAAAGKRAATGAGAEPRKRSK